jgi:hypothetical protein
MTNAFSYEEFDTEDNKPICQGIGCYYSFEKSYLFVGVVDETQKLTVIQEEIRTNAPIEDVAKLITQIAESNKNLTNYICINPHRPLKLSLKMKEIQETNLSDEKDLVTKGVTDAFKSLKANGRLELSPGIQELSEPIEDERIYAIKLLIHCLIECLYGTPPTEKFQLWSR